MSESNRIKLLELAIQGGATIENATKVASDWERWATEDDPLRLGTPSPVVDEIKGQEIDWSRPQLVKEIDGPRIGITNGEHHANWFQAELTYPGIGYNNPLRFSSYRKKDFTYHGEIPQEQPAEAKTACLNFLEAAQALNNGLLVIGLEETKKSSQSGRLKTSSLPTGK